MSGVMVKLSDLSDPAAFLDGARTPLTTTDGRRAECAGDLLFVWNPITASYGSCAVARMGCEPWLSIDLSDPDVAHCVDRKIAEAIGFINSEQAVFACNNGWTFWFVGDECPWFLSDQRPNIPLARAALLRALFGVSNA